MAELEEIIVNKRILYNSRSRGLRVYRHPATGDKNYDDKYEGISFLETWQPFDIPPSEGDALHVVTPGEEGRLDLISYRYYNNSNYDWVIAMVNNLPDMVQSTIRSESENKSPLVLRIPAQAAIEAAIPV